MASSCPDHKSITWNQEYRVSRCPVKRCQHPLEPAYPRSRQHIEINLRHLVKIAAHGRQMPVFPSKAHSGGLMVNRWGQGLWE